MNVGSNVTAIVDGLKADSKLFGQPKRLAYVSGKKISMFKAVTSDEAKVLENGTKDLAKLKDLIVAAVESDKNKELAKKLVVGAIDKKLESLDLNKGWSIFNGCGASSDKSEKVVTAIYKLEEIKAILTGEKKREAPSNEVKGKEVSNNNNIDNRASPPPSSSSSSAFSSSDSDLSFDGLPPPPPPPGMPGAPAANLPPLKSMMHRSLTDDPEKTVAEEATNPRPKIDEKHDLNKPKEISEADKAVYINAIEKYGAGLKEMLKKWTEQYEALKKEKAEVAEFSIDLEMKSGKVVRMAANIKKMEEAKAKGVSYDLKTAGKNATTVTFITDAAYEKLEAEYKKLSAKDIKELEKKDAFITIDRTLTRQIEKFKAALPLKQQEVDELSQDLRMRKDKIAKMEAEIDIRVKEGGAGKTTKRSDQPFVDLDIIIRDRTTVLANSTKAVDILTGKKKGAAETVVKKVEDGGSEAVKKLLNDPTLQQTAGQTNDRNAQVLIKKGTFYDELE